MSKDNVEEVTKTYTDENGEQKTITGFDVSEFPAPQNHDFYQEGRWLKCNCHPGRATLLHAGDMLTKTEGGYAINKLG